MSRKKVALITGTEGTRITLSKQLEDYIGDFAYIESYAIDLGIQKAIEADLVIISTSIIYEDSLKHVNKNCPIVVSKRAINYSKIEKMLYIPLGEEVLFVNDCRETTEESIEWLRKLGLDVYNYTPFYPGCVLKKDISYAVTPGELGVVPSGVKNVINIGPRLIDITTMTEILKLLGVFEEKWDEISARYLSKIITMGKRLAEESREKSKAYDHVLKVLDSVNEGLVAFNREGVITVFNENLKYILGIRKNIILGKNIRNIILDNVIQDFMLSEKSEVSLELNIRDQNFELNKLFIEEDGTTVVIFKSQLHKGDYDKETKRELYKKGYYGKYTFEDIKGTSSMLLHTKDVAKKLAKSELTVLIEGESGTGKELFASAIHNSSNRKDKPFVAVNFSSLAENLVESELFGYEEGAFTGALKGGKSGLFEQAEGGTILLDEIGDISPRVQARLLRVLQEKEIMRIGGNKIIPIDVRIIAATNANLDELVKKGQFRADLYHRLKVLYLKLPTLRDRKEDIMPIVEEILRSSGRETVIMDNAAAECLNSYSWPGNVRELKNTIDYMIAVCENNKLTVEDLPQESFFSSSFESQHKKTFELEGRGDLIFILKELYELNAKCERGSRQAILTRARISGVKLSEQMIRSRFEELEEQGYIQIKRGKSGTVITSKGVMAIKK